MRVREDLNPKDLLVGSSGDELEDMTKMEEMKKELDGLGKIQSDGSVDVDPAAMKEIVKTYVSPSKASSIIKDLEENIRLGFAMVRFEGRSAPIPWSLFKEEKVPDFLLEAIGIDRNEDSATVAESIGKKFSNAPDFMKDKGKITVLQRGVLSRPPRPMIEDNTRKIDSNETPAAAPSVPEILEKLKCIIDGRWNARWWGWFVTLEQDCASVVASVLKGTAGAIVVDVFWKIAAAIGAGAALAIIPVIVLAVLAGYLFLIGNAIEGFLKKGATRINLNGWWIPVMWVSRA